MSRIGGQDTFFDKKPTESAKNTQVQTDRARADFFLLYQKHFIRTDSLHVKTSLKLIVPTTAGERQKLIKDIRIDFTSPW